MGVLIGDFHQSLVDKDGGNILFKDQLGNTKKGFGLSTLPEVLRRPKAGSAISSIQDVHMHGSSLRFRAKLEDSSYKDLSLYEAKERGHAPLKAFLESRLGCMSKYPPAVQKALHKAIEDLDLGSDSSVL